METHDLAINIIETMNSRELSDLEKYLAEDSSFDFPGTSPLIGKKRILTFLKILFRKYPSLNFEIEDSFASGDKACVIWTNSGKSNKGEDYSNRGVTIVKAENGLIVSISDYFKDTSFTSNTEP